MDAYLRRAARAGRDSRHRLRLSEPRVLPPAAHDGDAHVPRAPPRARGSFRESGRAGHHGACRFHRARANGARIGVGGAGLRHAGAVSRQLRHHRCPRTGEPRKRAALRADRRRGAEAALAERDGRALQGAGRGPRCETAARRVLIRRSLPYPLTVREIALGLLLLAVNSAWADEIDEAKKRWESSPHGPLLERILPPTFAASQLPRRNSRGAKLVVAYCVQCHNLPNPAMHHSAKWPGIVDRMVPRMRGKGNTGTLMAEVLAGEKAPSAEEKREIIAYLRRNAQKPLDPVRYPEVNTPFGEAFRIACSQCHTLPDPQRHTAQEWPRVVARMQENMEWMNRVVGTKPVPGEPQLRVEEILAFLSKYARK